jgi:hypothetical protein
MRTILSAMLATILFSAVSFAAPSEAVQADKSAVDAACKADATTAGCGTEVVGKGLLKCLWSYKKANKDFKFSDGCKAAMKQLHADKQAGK